MWPWEHLAFGYLLVSAYHRLAIERRPGFGVLLAVVLGTQLPDLIDKPLAWSFGVLPSGLSLGHSLFFAIPVSLLAVIVSRARGRSTLGTTFAIAYGSHLLGDATYPLLTGGSFSPQFMLWPLVPASPEAGVGFLLQLNHFVSAFVRFLGTPTGRLYLLFEATLLLGTLLVWHLDGRPGVSWLRRRFRPEPTEVS
jgi:membrane-bound metal-dependent hydrolase YbcI (DUF457 family)